MEPAAELPADRLSTIHALQEAKLARRWAEARELELLAHVADVYDRPTTDEVLPGTERTIQPAGHGSPEFAEFACLEVAVALEESEEALSGRVTSALSLRHRFPRLWEMAIWGEFPVWLAQRISSLCLQLSAAQAARVDDAVADRATLSEGRLLALVEAMVLEFTQPELARDQHARERARRGVWFTQSESGIADARAILDAADAVFLNGQLNRIAGILADCGDTDPREVRRAKALGVLATPARALQFLQASILDQLPEDVDPECPAAGQRGHTCGQVTVDPEKLLPRAELAVHLTEQSLIRAARGLAGDAVSGEGAASAAPGLARSKGLKPLLAEWTRELLGHTRVAVRPVIDIPNLAPVDAYEIPDAMREAVSIRTPASAFPFSRRSSGNLDLDHTDPYVAGRKGQTRIDNLGPLARRHHRAKTHGGWQVRQIFDGVFVWRSPVGIISVSTPSGSWQLHTPPARC